MSRHRRTLFLRTIVALALAVALPAVAVAAQSRDAAVGTEGELFVVHAGPYGSLFPDAGLADPENPALALEIAHPNRPVERLPVPGTETSEVETNASVLFEDETGTLFLLWQTEKNGIHSWLNLIGFSDGAWTDVIEITGSPFGWKSSPQLAITRDTFQTAEEGGEGRTWKRTVLHLIWWESGALAPRLLYSPIVLLDGTYTGWNPVYHLDELEVASGNGPLAALNLTLARAPRIQAGRNGQSVVVGFVLADTGGLVTIEMEVLPGELGFLADKIRNQIIDVGRTLPDTPSSLAGKVRNQIIDVGARLGLHQSVALFLASRAEDRILAAAPGSPTSRLADEIRNQIIDVGARMTDRGFDRMGPQAKYQVIEFGNLDDDAPGGAPANIVRLVAASARPAPETGAGTNALFLSRSGREAVVAWVEDDAVYYRESRGSDGWSAPHRLRLVGELSPQRAWEILERRAEERDSSAPR